MCCLRFILWLIRKFTESSVGLDRLEEERSKWEPIKHPNTNFGFPLDQYPLPVRALYQVLSHIEVDDTMDLPNLNRTPKYEYQHRLPEEVTKPTDLATFLWSDCGSYFLRRDLGEDHIHIADFTDLEEYEVRPGYERYGGKVYMKDGQILGFEYLNKPYSADNLFMNRVIRASLCLKIMVEMHALRIHLCTAQQKALEYRTVYPKESKYLDLLSLMTFETLKVNRKTPVLLSKHGLFPRIFALTKGSYQRYVQDILRKGPLGREEILGYGSNGSPGIAWFDKVSEYLTLVSDFISKIMLDDCLTEDKDAQSSSTIHQDFTDFFTTVTALHNQFGDVQIYSMVVSGFLIPKVRSGQSLDVSKLDQKLLDTLLVAVTTRFPLITDKGLVDHFTDVKHKEAWSLFVEQAIQISSPWFDPKYFEPSVGF